MEILCKRKKNYKFLNVTMLRTSRVFCRILERSNSTASALLQVSFFDLKVLYQLLQIGKKGKKFERLTEKGVRFGTEWPIYLQTYQVHVYICLLRHVQAYAKYTSIYELITWKATSFFCTKISASSEQSKNFLFHQELVNLFLKVFG